MKADRETVRMVFVLSHCVFQRVYECVSVCFVNLSIFVRGLSRVDWLLSLFSMVSSFLWDKGMKRDGIRIIGFQ